MKVIITGATGMIGEGVLHQCLENAQIEKVLVITRNPSGYSHAKLEEIIHQNFFDFSAIASRFEGYNACFFCLGVSSMGKTEAEYTQFTYTLTLNFAKKLAELNPEMTFCYISANGSRTDEKGIMWARVRGKTENDLMRLNLNVYSFRPAALVPFLPLKPSQTYYRSYQFTKWLTPVIKCIAPNYISNLKDLANSMIDVARYGYSKNILEARDINAFFV